MSVLTGIWFFTAIFSFGAACARREWNCALTTLSLVMATFILLLKGV